MPDYWKVLICGEDPTGEAVPLAVNDSGHVLGLHVAPNNVLAYGLITNDDNELVETGMTFGLNHADPQAKELRDGAAETVEDGGTSITLPDGARLLEYKSDVAVIILWVGGAPGVGTPQWELSLGDEAWHALPEFDFSSGNAQADNANVVYITYDDSLSDNYLALRAAALVE